MNPILDLSGPPRFDEFRAEHVAPAIDVLLAEAEAALARATGLDVPATYDALSAVLDVATERLQRAWGAIGHLNAVADTPPWRAAYTASLPKIVAFHTKLGADERLYAKYKAIAASPAAAALPTSRRKALANTLRDFVLSGAELEGAAKERFARVQEELAEQSQRFAEHVLDATDSYAWYASEGELDGVPADTVGRLRDAAAAEGRDGCKVTLHMPSYLPVMQHAKDRGLRQRLYTAYVTRASEFGPEGLDNGSVMVDLLRLRQEEAAALGHADYAAVSLVPKMASSAAEVSSFLRDLARRARPGAERDLAELRVFARDRLGIDELQAWDMAFAGERLKEERYALRAEEVKPYLTEPRVLEGLFAVIETLFEVSVRADEAPVWHPSVRFFRIERTTEAGSELVGQFYLDLYARPGKRPGAWMGGARSRWRRPDGVLQTPLAHLVCNFAAPSADAPALLTHDQVLTLFHEFGHALQFLLTRVDDLGVSGISGVEWDAVELPSQFMENLAWEWDVLKRLTAHVETGEALPRELFERMHSARNYQSGLQLLRQVEMALIDMRLHGDADRPSSPQAIVAEVQAEVAVLAPPAFNRFLNGFSHIFAGGYAAGYYSYKWAEVLSADAWSAFEESAEATGRVLDAEIGRRWRKEVLESGGSRGALESFAAFRGRAPKIDALLRHQGLAP